jgi:hypothetical protein
MQAFQHANFFVVNKEGTALFSGMNPARLILLYGTNETDFQRPWKSLWKMFSGHPLDHTVLVRNAS